MTSRSFESILSAAQAGGEWALAAIYRELHPKVLGYLKARARDEAEDLASEVWIDVARGLGRFRGDEEGFRAWVFTIARRRLVDLHRRNAVRRDAFAGSGLAPGDQIGGDVEAEAMDALATEAALVRIANLPPDQADVVLLRILADLPVAEVARIVGKRPGAVRALQLRALRSLARTASREGVTR
jgi:RNA polymerase sigma-70 factor (ECF subfamily)